MKLIARAKSIKTLDAYKELFADPLFDRSMFEIIIKRLENRKAFDEYEEFNKTQKIESDFDKEMKKILLNEK